jgi:hypothetical protein
MMPKYEALFTYIDSLGGSTYKLFEGEFDDFAAAKTSATALKSDVVALTKAAVIRLKLSETEEITATPTAGSTVFEKVSATVELETAGKYANLQMPAPVAAIMAGNALNPAATLWTNFTDNFTTDWTISDGEHIAGTRNGKRVFVNSGSTNLPS